MVTHADGRKYGRGKYGAKSYDLGVVHVLPPWIPIPDVPVEAWIPIPTQPAWADSTNPDLYATEKWKPVLMPVN